MWKRVRDAGTRGGKWCGWEKVLLLQFRVAVLNYTSPPWFVYCLSFRCYFSQRKQSMNLSSDHHLCFSLPSQPLANSNNSFNPEIEMPDSHSAKNTYGGILGFAKYTAKQALHFWPVTAYFVFCAQRQTSTSCESEAGAYLTPTKPLCFPTISISNIFITVWILSPSTYVH